MVDLLLDEHVSRVFEHVLELRGFHACQAKDRFGERTSDAELLNWCASNGAVFVTNNAKDFERLHGTHEHDGLFLYRQQDLPDVDPEGLATAASKPCYPSTATTFRAHSSNSTSGTSGFTTNSENRTGPSSMGYCSGLTATNRSRR